MEKPSVGRIVHVVHRDVCRAAIVTATHGDDVVSVCVFNPGSTVFKPRVKFDSETKEPATWHFPERVEAPSPADQVAEDAEP